MGLGVDARSVAERGFRKAAEEFPQTLEDLAAEINNQHLEYPCGRTEDNDVGCGCSVCVCDGGE